MIRLSKRKKRSETMSRMKPSHLRITKDINDLNLPQTCEAEFPDPDDIYHFKLAITPDEGFYKNYRIIFDFKISVDYPYEPPRVKCETDIYHPNIDGEGNVCLNILREDWKPVLSLNSVIYGLQYLLLEPNPDDALNEAAARQLQYDFPGFVLNVKDVASGRKNLKFM